MGKVKIKGLRSKHSPLQADFVPAVQKEAVRAEVARISDANEAKWIIEVQWTPYIGPGSAGDRGDITISVDGRIHSMITKEGKVY